MPPRCHTAEVDHLEPEQLDVDGRRMSYRRAGAGDPLVLLHGGWSDSRAWSHQLGSLSDDFDVLAFDVPGCGGSDDPPGPVPFAWYADAVADLIDTLDLGPVHLGGLSFGAGLALAFAQRYPAKVRSLVLAGAYAGWAGSLPADEVAARLTRLRGELARPPSEWADAYLAEFFHTDPGPEPTELFRTMLHSVRPAGTLPMIEAFAAADLRPGLAGLDRPTLLMVGEHDVRAPLPVARAIHAALPDSRLVVVPGVGHDVHVEAPGFFEREVRAFLAGL
ncbi:alpha/beta fold hydrolase [Nocardioides bigeumensis]|uniref:Alpha/beta fold hydrolase n=1 Tax=Nocardioides bigeumensis TaxID=433657 RepID=A0ABN2YKX5_9ACTN